jgi:hypothetical protein
VDMIVLMVGHQLFTWVSVIFDKAGDISSDSVLAECKDVCSFIQFLMDLRNQTIEQR